jgi:hypothetical protein
MDTMKRLLKSDSVRDILNPRRCNCELIHNRWVLLHYACPVGYVLKRSLNEQPNTVFRNLGGMTFQALTTEGPKPD